MSGISRTADYVRAYPKQYALLLSVELCSLTWQEGDESLGNLVATGLFGALIAASGSFVAMTRRFRVARYEYLMLMCDSASRWKTRAAAPGSSATDITAT